MPRFQQQILLPTPAATERLGALVGARLQAGQAVALRGELGAGKTAFARGAAIGLAVDDPDAVCSPTYLLVVEHAGPLPLLHVDAYLPQKTRAFLEDGGADYLRERGGVAVIEWADRIAELLPPATLWVTLAPAVIDGHEGRTATLAGGEPFAWIMALPNRIEA